MSSLHVVMLEITHCQAECTLVFSDMFGCSDVLCRHYHIAMQVAELKDLCRQENVKGYSKLKKDQLVSLLQDQLQSK